MRRQTVCISVSPLPPRARRLEDAELSRIFGGCHAWGERCANEGGPSSDKACCSPYECWCEGIACRCYEKIGENYYR